MPARFSVRHHAATIRMSEAGEEARKLLAEISREHPQTVENLLLTADGEHDDLERAAKTLRELCREFGSDVDRFETLAVAVSLVHDSEKRLTRSVNGATTRSPGAREIFAFFAERMKQGEMRSDLAPELLAYVVDATVDEGQLRWAATEYAGNTADQSLYKLVPYDTTQFQGGRRAMSGRRYTLVNVRQYGGICADRSFFATNVGKAIGMPSAYVRGIRPEVTHAWVAHLDLQTGKWREYGRSSRYSRVAGRIVSPQTGATINEDELRALGQMAHLPETDRLEALAMAHLARTQRHNALQMVRSALELNAACLPAWRELRRRQANELSDIQMSEWQTFITQRCSKGLATRMLLDLAGAVDDPQRRQAAYERVYDRAAKNDDLACEVRFRQAVDLASAGDTRRALELCRDAAVKHWTSGKGALLLANTARDIAMRDKKRDELLEVYAAVFMRLPAPKTSAEQFTGHTAWRLLGEDYARSLKEHGRDIEAREILERIGAPSGS